MARSMFWNCPPHSQVVSLRQCNLPIHSPLKLCDKAAKVTILDVHANDNAALGLLAADLGRSLDDPDPGQIFQRHQCTVWGIDEKVADRLHIPAEILRQADYGFKSALSLINGGGAASSYGSFNHVVDIRYVKPVTGNGLPVNFDGQILLSRYSFHFDILGPLDSGCSPGDGIGCPLEHVQIVLRTALWPHPNERP